MKVIALANQKGGVGKTTTAVNLSACLAAAEQRTLLIDLDPQGNSTSGLGISKNNLSKTIYDVVVHQIPLSEVLVKTQLKYLAVAPANTQLVGAELELVSAFSRERRLQQSLQQVSADYDYVIIDCPPSLSLLTVNALTAATGILIPVQCEYFAMEGVSELVKTIQLIQQHLNPNLELEGVLLTMFDGRNNLARQVSQEIQNFFGEKVFTTVIARNIKLSESPSHGQSIIMYDAFSKGAKNYLELAKELLQRHGKFETQNPEQIVQNEFAHDFDEDTDPGISSLAVQAS